MTSRVSDELAQAAGYAEVVEEAMAEGDQEKADVAKAYVASRLLLATIGMASWSDDSSEEEAKS